jgi:hypothetical protein
MNTAALFAAAVAALTILPENAPAAARLTLTGKVTDAQGKALDHATVLVYHAGVKQGYSTFCPSCYTDCGKRVITDSLGNFNISSLSPDLLFEILVVHDGYLPAFVEKVDPAKSTPVAVLQPRAAVTDLHRILRGLVVDDQHHPIRDAVVQPQGILGEFVGRGRGSQYGTIAGLDPVAVTDSRGQFELAHTQAFDAMVLQVEARGMAPKIFTSLASGAARHTLVVTEGATIRGRLVQNGKPVANAELGLMARQHGWRANLALVGYPLSEIRIGTNADGTFDITNVPPGVDWYLYGKMESLTANGGAPIIECATKRDGEELDVGDLGVPPAFHLRGKVVLSDGQPMAPGMHITIGPDRGFDTQTTEIASDGGFEFSGLVKGGYNIFASVRGYRLLSHRYGSMPLRVENNVADFVMRLDPQ